MILQQVDAAKMLRDPPSPAARGRHNQPWSDRAEQLAERVLRLQHLLDHQLCHHGEREPVRAKLGRLTAELEILRREEWSDAARR